MEITTHPAIGHVELRVAGRLDATWAGHLGSTIENIIRGGQHRVVLNFAGVDYISSLGIRVLLTQYQLLRSVNGSLTITQPSIFCREVLTVVGLSEMICDEAVEAVAVEAVSKERRGNADYEIYPQHVARALTCKPVGDPARLTTTGFAEADCRRLSLPDETFAVGLGAFGQGYADCRDRFGEFLAVGGCVIAQPTNEAQAHPDYVMEEGRLVPQVETLYALAGEGDFPTMVRFDASPDGPGKVGISELIGSLLDIAQAESVAVVVLAEAAGIVGATLLQSPAERPLLSTLPEVREWLSFTTERSSERSLCLMVGVASRTVGAEMKTFLRPIQAGSTTSAHLHAAVFPYRPVQRGELSLRETVTQLLNASSPGALLHLMADARPFEGVGETDLLRGACWFGPLTTIARTSHP